MNDLIERFFLLIVLLSMVITVTVRAEDSKQPAFPGAEGFGKYAKGGRAAMCIS